MWLPIADAKSTDVFSDLDLYDFFPQQIISPGYQSALQIKILRAP